MAIRPADHGVIASSAGGVDYFMTGIMDVTVVSNSQNYVNLSFSSYNADYDAYKISCFARSKTNNRQLAWRMNNDSNSYRYTSGQMGYTQGSTPGTQAGSSSGSQATLEYASNGTSHDSDYFSWTDIWVSKKYNDSGSNAGTETYYEGRGTSNGGGMFVSMGWGRWNMDGTEMTSMQLYAGGVGQQWLPDSRIMVYGIKYGS